MRTDTRLRNKTGTHQIWQETPKYKKTQLLEVVKKRLTSRKAAKEAAARRTARRGKAPVRWGREVQAIFGARIPLLKLKAAVDPSLRPDATVPVQSTTCAVAGQTVPLAQLSTAPVDVDLSVGGNGAAFKADVLKILTLDSPPEVRDFMVLVKLWAKANGFNDPMGGTFNSFALNLLAIFHLQSVGLLPAFGHLLAGLGECGRDARFEVLATYAQSLRAVEERFAEWRRRHCERLADRHHSRTDLLGGFLLRMGSLVACGPTACVSLYHAKVLDYAKVPELSHPSPLFQLQDPFALKDNVCRTVGEEKLRHIRASFAQAPNQLRNAVKQGLRGSYDQLLKGVLRMVAKASEGDAAGGRVYAFATDPPKKKARKKKGAPARIEYGRVVVGAG